MKMKRKLLYIFLKVDNNEEINIVDYDVAILTPLNKNMQEINAMCLDRWHGRLQVRYSLDSVDHCDRELAQITSQEVLFTCINILFLFCIFMRSSIVSFRMDSRSMTYD